MSKIEKGQVWRSRDRRTLGHEVTVLNTPNTWGNDYVHVQGIHRKSLIRTLVFRRTYELVDPTPRADHNPLAADDAASTQTGGGR